MLAEVIGVTVKMKWGVDPGPRPLFNTPMRARAAAGVWRRTRVQHQPTGVGPVRLRVSPTARPTPTVRLPDRLRQSDCQTDSDSPTARPETAASAPARALTCRVLYDRSLEYAEGLHNHAKYFLLTAQASIHSGAPHSALFTSGQPRLQSSIPVNALTWIPICYPPHPQKRVKLPWKLLISSSLDMRDPMRTHTLRLLKEVFFVTRRPKITK